MSIFSSIMEKLGIGKAKAAEAPVPAPEAPKADDAAAQQPVVAAEEIQGTTPDGQKVDVVAVCEALAAKNPQKLDWKHSIVDLLKLLGIDSSLENRKKLAEELHCPAELIGGDFSKMNMWLHKAVLQELAKNGGHVPEELLK